MKNIKTEHKRHLKNNYMIISYGSELEDILSVYRHEYRMLKMMTIATRKVRMKRLSKIKRAKPYKPKSKARRSPPKARFPFRHPALRSHLRLQLR